MSSIASLKIGQNKIVIGNRVLLKSYKNNDNWYNLYSDGWCEQGGYKSGGTSIITLDVPYTDNKYTVLVTPGYYNLATIFNFSATDRTSTQFRLVVSDNAETADNDRFAFWETKGYVDLNSEKIQGILNA